jgi:hypothetical protein
LEGEVRLQPLLGRGRSRDIRSVLNFLSRCNAVNKPGYEVNTQFEKTKLCFNSNLARTHSKSSYRVPRFCVSVYGSFIMLWLLYRNIRFL